MIRYCYDLIKVGKIKFAPTLKFTEIKYENLRFQMFISIMVQIMKVDSIARNSISLSFF